MSVWEIRGDLSVGERVRLFVASTTKMRKAKRGSNLFGWSTRASSSTVGRQKGERQRSELTPRDSQKNFEIAKIPGTFGECISVATLGTWPHDVAIEFVRQWPPDVSVLQLAVPRHNSPSKTRAHGRQARLSDVPGLSNLNDLAAPCVPAKSKPTPLLDQVSYFIRGSRKLAGSSVEFQTACPVGVHAITVVLGLVAKHDLGSP